MNIEKIRSLPSPLEVKNMLPLREDLAKIKQENDEKIREVLEGKNDKLLLIIGPCSADREDAVIEYIKRLRTLQEKVEDVFVIV